MRSWTRISTNSTIRFAAVVLGAIAVVVPCAAHDSPAFAVETGYPSYLVNRPRLRGRRNLRGLGTLQSRRAASGTTAVI